MFFFCAKKDPNNAMHDFDQNVITFVSAFKVAPRGLVAKCSTKVSSGLIAIVLLPSVTSIPIDQI